MPRSETGALDIPQVRLREGPPSRGSAQSLPINHGFRAFSSQGSPCYH